VELYCLSENILASPLRGPHTRSTQLLDEEDFALSKALAVLPVVGHIFSVPTHWSLESKITEARKEAGRPSPRVFQLIRLGKQYAILGVARELFTTASVVAATALNFLTPTQGAYLAGFFIIQAGANIVAARSISMIPGC